MGVMAVLLPILSGAQSPPIKPLIIGDTVRDITIANVYNYPDSIIHLSDLKGKLVILDFWATWCGPCISSFPKLIQLKEAFGNRLNIICVNSDIGDHLEKVQTEFSSLKKRLNIDMHLPYSLYDPHLMKLFPHKALPHYVWIDTNNVVLGFTSSNDVTASNIRAIFQGKEVSLNQKRDELLYDPEKPLLVGNNCGEPDDFLYRSVITPYNKMAGYSMGHKIDENGRVVKMYFMNSRLSILLTAAYPELGNYNVARTIYKVKNPDKYKTLPDQQSEEENLYCFELICPPVEWLDLQKILQNELEKYFLVTVSFEKIRAECWVLKNSDSHCPGQNTMGYNPQNNVRKKSMAYLIKRLEENLGSPVIDETGISVLPDIEYPANFSKLAQSELKVFLKKEGLQLSPANKEMKMAVISEKDYNTIIQN